MSAFRTLFSCFGLFLLCFFVFAFLWGAAGFYATRAVVAGAERDRDYYEEEFDAERERALDRMAERRRAAEQRREGIRVNSRSGQPMQRPRPMTDRRN